MSLLRQQPDATRPARCGSRGERVSLPHAVSPHLAPLLVQQELLDGVRQWQRGNQMEPVFAKSSSHGHTAQGQQGPRDTWGAGGEGDEERLVPSRLRSDGAVTGRSTCTHAPCQRPNSGASRAGKKACYPLRPSAEAQSPHDRRHLLRVTTPLDCLHP